MISKLDNIEKRLSTPPSRDSTPITVQGIYDKIEIWPTFHKAFLTRVLVKSYVTNIGFVNFSIWVQKSFSWKWQKFLDNQYSCEGFLNNDVVWIISELMRSRIRVHNFCTCFAHTRTRVGKIRLSIFESRDFRITRQATPTLVRQRPLWHLCVTRWQTSLKSKSSYVIRTRQNETLFSSYAVIP